MQPRCGSPPVVKPRPGRRQETGADLATANVDGGAGALGQADRATGMILQAV
ncbi:hypothetical protein ACIQCD_29515 [Streptomyces sp. NPDC093250]|uniref:hypothetical protein n=1 Tax=Streptomyces sp. NPDC093250 TaxID=3366036 RepID=UPI00381DBD53